MGDDDGEELPVGMQAEVPPVEKRVTDCSLFIKRVRRAEAASASQKAEEFKRQCDDEVAAAERRLKVLQRKGRLLHQRRVDQMAQL